MAGRLSVGAILTLRDEMSDRLDRARGTAKRFVDQIHEGVSHVDKFTSSIAQSGAKMLQHFGDSARAMFDKFFSTIKLGAGLAAAALGAFVFKGVESSMEFEAQIRHATGLLVASGASSDQADAAFKQFSDGILQAAPQLAKTPEDLAKSLYLPLSVMVQYGNVGASVTDTLKVVTAASKAATAGFADASTVTTALSRVLGAYGASADEAAHYTDIMQQAVNYGLMTFSDLATGIGKVAGPAAALHIPFEQVAAAIATITRRGILPDEAFTALNKFMLAIEKPHPEAITNLQQMFGPDWQKHFSATALAANGLSGVLDDLMGHVKPTKDQLAQLSQATDFGTDEDIRAAGANILGSRVDQLIGIIGDVRGLRGVLALTATDGNTSFATALGLTGNAVGAVDKQFAEYSKTTQFAKDQFSSFLDVLKESVLGNVLPGLGDRFKEMSGALAELTANPVFQEADLGTKLQMIGSVILDALHGVPAAIGDAVGALWHGITDWWSSHQSEIEKDIQDFFDWLGNVAIPWATEAAVKLGAVLGPALIQSLVSMLSTPTGLGTAALLLGLKVVVPSVLNGGGGAAAAAEGATALSGAAAELSGAATALVSAAEALGGAAASEEGAAATLAAGGGAAGAAEAGGLLAGVTTIQLLGSIALVAGSVYFTAKAYGEAKGQVDAAAAQQDHSITSALQSGNYSGVAQELKGENAVKAGQNWASDFSEAIGSAIGFESASEAAKGSVLTYIDNAIKSAVTSGDMTQLNSLISGLKTNGVWDALGTSITDALNTTLTQASDTIESAKGVENLQSLMAAGADVSSVLGAQADAISKLPLDQQKKALQDIAASDPHGFALAMHDLVSHTISQQPAMRTSADLAQNMATQLATLNPPLATFFQNMATMLGQLAGWVPPVGLGLPSGTGAAGPNPTALSGPLVFNPATGTVGLNPTPPPQPGLGSGIGSTGPPPLQGIDPRRTHPQAAGGFGTAYKATYFTAGEAGTEDFAFAPHSKGGMAALLGNAGGVTVKGPLIGSAVIREEADVAKIAAQLALELERRSSNASRGTNK